jgi:hypothetical protein
MKKCRGNGLSLPQKGKNDGKVEIVIGITQILGGSGGVALPGDQEF